MKRLLSAVLVLVLGALPAAAQEFDATPLTIQDASSSPAPTSAEADGPRQIHVTDWLAQWPEARQAAAEYQRRKAQGALPSANKVNQDEPALGDTLTFRVANIDTGGFDEIDFKLMAEHERFYIWVELAELDDGNVLEADVAALKEAMGERTPEASLFPDLGILEINESLFGSPPDVDGDDKTDVLLVDIRDGYDPGAGNNSFVGGFVTRADLSNQGNNRDVLYLDTNPGLVQSDDIDRVAETAAHEYQHLIHFNYDLNEETFVNEGLSEWAELANGYQGRSINYLGDADRYNVDLLRWSGNANISVLDDYQRAGLFTTYLAERIGPDAIGEITREESDGVDGYQDVLDLEGADADFEGMLVDFHLANLLNDADLDARFGYTYPQRLGLRAVPNLEVDGRTTTETPEDDVFIRPGAVAYLVWDNVTDLEVTLNSGATGTSFLTPQVITEQGETVTVEPLDLSSETFTFSGDYRRVAIVVPHTNPDASSLEQLFYSATWSNEATFTSESITFDNGQARDFVLGGGVELLTRFENPSPNFAFLATVQLPIYYYSQFSNPEAPPPSAPRDFTFVIRDAVDAGDGTLEPGDVLFTLPDIPDPRSYQGVTSSSLSFAELDLADYQEEMIDLPNTFFVGYVDTNPGNDDNQIVLVTSPYNQENRTFIGPTQNGWRPLWDIELSDGTSLSNTIVPVRAEFLVSSQPVATDTPSELPEQVALQQNFPNPFNPTTTIRYSLPQSGAVTLAVYDLLGRQVTTLVDGVQTAGAHTVTLDASEWASGLYFYTLQANGQRQTRRMVLVK